MGGSTIYDNKTDGEPLKLRPKAEYSSDYRERKNIRMVAYCRVSTDKKEQEASFEAQQDYYREYIPNQANCVYAGIYADEASGKNTKKRDDFLRMLEDARAGKFDMIITKDASRFARNQVDGLLAIQELLALKPPVGVIFENDNLNTLRPDCGLYVQFMLSMAQGEIERKSMSVKWAFRQRCEDKNYPAPTAYLIGYTTGADEKLVIEPEGAATVKAIYAMYLHGVSINRIAFLLSKAGKKTGKNNTIWSPSSVINILRNEKYCGDVVAQKSIIVNVLLQKSEKNEGRSTLYYNDNHHAAIVSRDEHIRALLLLRANSRSVYFNPRYEVRVIRNGLLKGFIPLNCAFGGYDAGHYLGAWIKSNTKLGDYAANVVLLDGYRMVRAQEVQHHFTAQMTVGMKGFTFNAECLAKLPTEFVEILLHPAERLIAVRAAVQTNPDALTWQSNISAALLCPVFFELMGWQETWKYKFIADCHIRGNERVLMFNLSEPEYQFSEDIVENELKQELATLGVEYD